MTPEQLAKSGTEDAHQMALFAALNARAWYLKSLPCVMNSLLAEQLLWVHSIPNGGYRHKATAGRLKATGAKSGVWDIFVPVPMKKQDAGPEISNSWWHGLYVEMKKPDERPVRSGSRGGLADEQIEFGRYLLRHDYAHIVCYTWEEAYAAIRNYIGDES